MKTKDQLLKELAELGVHPSGRKIRTDVGKSHNYTKTKNPSKPRAARKDAGQVRNTYTKTASYHKRIFTSYIAAHTDGESNDDLIRDFNEIFPPNVNSRYKLIVSKNGHQYRSPVKRRNHPEALRWAWWFAEWQEADTLESKIAWETRISNWYFIRVVDMPMWTYPEWAWAYVKAIGGNPNRDQASPIILHYDDFVAGIYGIPTYDDKGDLMWIV